MVETHEHAAISKSAKRRRYASSNASFGAGVRPIFAKQKSTEGEQALYLGCNVKTAMEALAKQIERQMHGKLWAQCAIYERVSERIWPLNEKDREAKIAQFAKKYGFRLRFYSQGMCASSTNGRDQIANESGAVGETHEHKAIS